MVDSVRPNFLQFCCYKFHTLPFAIQAAKNVYIFLYSSGTSTNSQTGRQPHPILSQPPHSVSLVNLFIYTSVFFNFNKKFCLHGWWVFEICMFTIPSFNMHLSQRYYPILVATRVEPIERISSTFFPSLSLLCLFKLFFCKWQLEEPCWCCCCCWLHTKQMHYFKDIIKIASFLFLFRIPKS